MKRKVLDILIIVVFLLITCVLIVSCAYNIPNVENAQETVTMKKLYDDNFNMKVFSFIDKTNHNICYLYHTGNGSSIDCLPEP